MLKWWLSTILPTPKHWRIFWSMILRRTLSGHGKLRGWSAHCERPKVQGLCWTKSFTNSGKEPRHRDWVYRCFYSQRESSVGMEITLITLTILRRRLSSPFRRDEIDNMIVLGVNAASSKPRTLYLKCQLYHQLFAPIAKVLHDNLGIVQGIWPRFTLHQWSSCFRFLIATFAEPVQHWARFRPPLEQPAVGKILPELKGKPDGTSAAFQRPQDLRDLVAILQKSATIEEINVHEESCTGSMKGILSTQRMKLFPWMSFIIHIPLFLMRKALW